jgi:hypothetical protein
MVPSALNTYVSAKWDFGLYRARPMRHSVLSGGSDAENCLSSLCRDSVRCRSVWCHWFGDG